MVTELEAERKSVKRVTTQHCHPPSSEVVGMLAGFWSLLIDPAISTACPNPRQRPESQA